MATRGCRNSSDSFCYVCGFYVGPKHVSHKIVKGAKYWIAYRLYFGMSMGDQDKPWVPHVICGSCWSNLDAWLRSARKSMPFAVPRVWREPKNHDDDCMIDISKYRKVKGRKFLPYPSLPSSIALVPHDDTLLVPRPPENVEDKMEVSGVSEGCEDEETDETFEPRLRTRPHFPNQRELDDLILRNLGLTKSRAELLASRLDEWNLLGEDCKSTVYRKSHEESGVFFNISDDLCLCKDINININGLFSATGIDHNYEEWRLFIDSSTNSLKAVLLHNGNQYPSLPIAYSVHMKEEYDNVKKLFEKVNYNEFKWDICGDFKMLAFLLGLQGGFTKYSCFLCLWDTRVDHEHYQKVEWPPRDDLQPDKWNVIRQPLVKPGKVLLPLLHINSL
ncbi:uncharacterized protein LOC123517160 [Portunus trituberculatus]|uniref:uncharacterized protein LOC123517160 n=1 Tax=Portunus trituberculatus TaxID=210409 RepID=UPI001E1CFB8C|nr:uncharacterized protein LOC123517160 [Portunus trituberculatus]